jgi:gluconokinase
MLGITRDKLPEIVSPYEIESGLSLDDAQKMNIPPDTSFI